MDSIQKILEQNQYQKFSLREVADSYNHIELTEDEMLEAIIDAKRKKEAIKKAEELKQREEYNRRALTQTRWDCNQTEAYMKYRAGQIFKGKFDFDDTNSIIFKILCYYFSDDINFENLCDKIGVKNPSRSKGIMLAGNYGTGKTWMMTLFTKNQRQVFHIRNAKHIANAYEVGGGNSDYINNHENPSNDKDSFFQKYAGLCVDDIGTEEIKSNYGNKKNVIGELLELRYANGNAGVFLHATTNLTADQLRVFYGERVVSRMREMFNFIEFPGADRRS